MEKRWEPNFQGFWTIEAPKDMPVAQVRMLKETIAAYWAEYPGDPNDTELFWDFLTECMSNVPRETSPPTNAHDALVELLQKDRLQQDPPPSEAEWEAHMQGVRRRAELLNDVDVPRETSEGES